MVKLWGRVGTTKQITQCPSPAQRQPDPLAMLRAVMQQVAALAECLDVAVPTAAMGWVVIKVGCCQYDLGGSYRHILEGR
jgi:hypothetical protein